MCSIINLRVHQNWLLVNHCQAKMSIPNHKIFAWSKLYHFEIIAMIIDLDLIITFHLYVINIFLVEYPLYLNIHGRCSWKLSNVRRNVGNVILYLIGTKEPIRNAGFWKWMDDFILIVTFNSTCGIEYSPYIIHKRYKISESSIFNCSTWHHGEKN